MNIKLQMRRLKYWCYKYLTWLLGIGKPIEKKILFCSFGGKQYSDNPRAISEKMHELYPDFQIVWGVISNENLYKSIPEYVKKVNMRSIQYRREKATTFAFVTNGDNSVAEYKRKGQFYVQTWHGDRGFKNVLYATRDAKGLREWKDYLPITDNKLADLFIAGSEFGKKKIKAAFHYNGPILMIGSPKNDILVNGSKEIALKTKEKLGIAADTKILLYAPTFRDSLKEKQSVEVDLNGVVDELEKSGEKWICLMRAHTASKGLNLDLFTSSRFLDVTEYPDMADLLLVTDFLITDYSGSATDFILCKKPIILTIFDIEDYRKSRNGFLADPEEVGFFVAKNNDELLKLVREKTAEEYVQNCESICQYYGVCETGEASEIVCNILNDHYITMHGGKDS